MKHFQPWSRPFNAPMSSSVKAKLKICLKHHTFQLRDTLLVKCDCRTWRSLVLQFYVLLVFCTFVKKLKNIFTFQGTNNIHWTQCKVSISSVVINMTNCVLWEESLPLYFQVCDETCYSLVWLQHSVARGTSATPAKTSHSLYFTNIGMFDGISWTTFANLRRASFVLLGDFCNYRVFQDPVWVAVSI